MRLMLRLVPIIVMLLAVNAVGQDFNVYGFTANDYGFKGSGARARAMGGAFTGLANDASALTWNPAGLIQMSRTQASVAGSYYLTELTSSITYPSSSNFNSTIDDKKGLVSFASFVAPIRIKGHPFTASASYQNVANFLGEHNSWARYDYEGSNPDTTLNALRNNNTFWNGDLFQYSLGFGTGLYSDVSIGGSVNIYTGSQAIDYRNDFLDTVLINQGAGLPLEVEWNLNERVVDTISVSGFNFAGGLFYKHEKFSVGVFVESPFELIFKHDIIFRDTLWVNNVATFPNDQGPPQSRIFTAKTKYKVPVSVSSGVSVAVNENLTLSGDFEFRRFSKTTYFVKTADPEGDERYRFNQETSIYYSDTSEVSYFTSSGEEIEIFDEYSLKHRNGVEVRFGAEYMLNTKAGIIPLRAGYRFANMPYTDVKNLSFDGYNSTNSGFDMLDAVQRKVITLGTGIHWSQIWLDFTAEFQSETQTITGPSALGDYSLEDERTFPTLTFNFTGYF